MQFLISITITIFLWNTSNAQLLQTKKLSLPTEIKDAANQFSGLFNKGKFVYLLSESRIQDKDEAKLYILNKKELRKQLKDSSVTLNYKKIPIANLPILAGAMKKMGDEFEGLEAIYIKHKTVYVNVETETASPNCYMLKGVIKHNTLVLDTSFFTQLPKPKLPNQSIVYNAGFEALTFVKRSLQAIYEYNYFDSNYVLSIAKNNMPYKTPISKVPFRITDVCKIKPKQLVGINYFYKGGGADTVYRVATTDSNYSLTISNNYIRSFARLISLNYQKKKFVYSTYKELPPAYYAYNWEGICRFKNGFLLINDKYTPQKPYETTLLFVK